MPYSFKRFAALLVLVCALCITAGARGGGRSVGSHHSARTTSSGHERCVTCARESNGRISAEPISPTRVSRSAALRFQTHFPYAAYPVSGPRSAFGEDSRDKPGACCYVACQVFETRELGTVHDYPRTTQRKLPQPFRAAGVARQLAGEAGGMTGRCRATHTVAAKPSHPLSTAYSAERPT